MPGICGHIRRGIGVKSTETAGEGSGPEGITGRRSDGVEGRASPLKGVSYKACLEGRRSGRVVSGRVQDLEGGSVAE